MLQPTQLADVSCRYYSEICELRSFLAKASVPVGTADAVADIANRVQHDKAFHRDLVTHLWVATEGADRSIDYADLLALMALAAAGMDFAADAQEQDAIALLRFLKVIRTDSGLIDAKRSPLPSILRSVPAFESDLDSPRALTPVPEPSSLYSAVGPNVGEHIAELSPLREQNWRRWWLAGGCAAATVLLLLWSAHRGASPTEQTDQRAAALQPGREPDFSVTPRYASGSQLQAHRQPNQLTISSPTSTGASPGLPTSHAGIASSVAGPAASPSPASTLVASAVPVSPSLHGLSAGTPSAPITVGPLPSRPAGDREVPSSVLSKWLGARSIPDSTIDPTLDEAPDKSRRPRLLRRHPGVTPQNVEVADLEPIDAPTQGVRSMAQKGTVRPTSLGTMAANVMYSPAPVYPAEASAAHVSGEVRVQAQVDRDGAVSYARVVSGPPLLRNAALSAVQQWRYRPYLSNGKAVPTTTLAVVDFELP